MNETVLRDRIVETAQSLFARLLTFGASGNISVRLDDGWLMTPTGHSMGSLDPEKISRLDKKGNWISGDKPTKEAMLHLAMYRQRPGSGAVVHLHSTHSVAVSCLAEVDHENVLPPITAYYVMRVGRLPLLPYHPPGDPALADVISEYATRHHAVLLANHGPVVAGAGLEDAACAIEELEETARLYLMLRHSDFRSLTDEQVEELRKRFPVKA